MRKFFILAVAFLSAPLQAQILSVSYSGDNGTFVYGGQGFGDLQIEEFNPFVGVLDSVTVQFTGHAFFDFQTDPAVYYSPNYAISANYPVQVGSYIFNVVVQASGNAVILQGYGGLGAEGSSTATLSSSDPNMLRTFAGPSTVTAHPVPEVPYQFDLSSGRVATASVRQPLTEYKVTYNFHRAPPPPPSPAIPEAESWMMMIAGFALTGAALRRRNSMEISIV